VKFWVCWTELSITMSKNFFAALDDSGDEAEVAKVKVTKKEIKKPPAKVAPIEPAKNERRRGNHNDRNTKQGRGRAPARDGKRAYDRRSGTGRGKEIKKGGGGARNWGNDKNEARKAEGTVNEGEEAAATEPKPEETEAAPQGSEEAAAPAPEVVEEEDKTMTLEEYMESKRNPDSTAFKPFAEKELVNEFAGKASVKAVEEDFLKMGGGKSLRKKGSKKDQKATLDVGFKVSSSDDPRRDDRRGDRRGGRGGRGPRSGGGRGRGGRQGGAINVADVNSFPSL
jgi:plasminogen activator inhibitor 1 RNA-binding protein